MCLLVSYAEFNFELIPTFRFEIRPFSRGFSQTLILIHTRLPPYLLQLSELFVGKVGSAAVIQQTVGSQQQRAVVDLMSQSERVCTAHPWQTSRHPLQRVVARRAVLGCWNKIRGGFIAV